MSTIAVVGAGPQLGLAVARRFAREGFDVALVARSQPALDVMVQALAVTMDQAGRRAVAVAADLRDRTALDRALSSAEERLGPIEVLQFSPAPSRADLLARPLTEAAQVTVESVQPEVEMWVYGGITAVQHVLPGMLSRGHGTVLVTTGAGSGPMVIPQVANVQVATAGLRNWVLNLHASVADRGVHVSHVGIAAAIGGGRPDMEPDVLADAYWRLHTERRKAEVILPAAPEPGVVPELAVKNRVGAPGTGETDAGGPA